MPREARVRSNSGIYHIMLRGANRQEIFHEEEDRIKFLKIIKKYKMITQMKIFAWCLIQRDGSCVSNVESPPTIGRLSISYLNLIDL